MKEERSRATQSRTQEGARRFQKGSVGSKMHIAKLNRTFPEVLEAALSSILVGNKFLTQSYEHDKSPLENYQARLIFKDAFRPYLERHAPERIQAVRTQYATEIAALDEQIAALQTI